MWDRTYLVPFLTKFDTFQANHHFNSKEKIQNLLSNQTIKNWNRLISIR